MDWATLLNDFGLPTALLVVFGLVIRVLWKKIEKEQVRYDELSSEYRTTMRELHKEKEALAKDLSNSLDSAVQALRRQRPNSI